MRCPAQYLMHFDLWILANIKNMKTFLVLVTVSACLVVANGVLTDYRSSLKHFLDRGPTKVRAEPAKKDIAVSVDGGDQEAESVAGKCGVSYNGQVPAE